MPSVLPDGEPMPDDGALPGRPRTVPPSGLSGSTCTCRTARPAAATATSTPTPPTELGPGGVLASRENTRAPLIDEIRLARKVLGDDPRPVRTVFVGGGTPTLLAADDLVRDAGGGPGRVRAGRRRRGHHRGQPGVGRPGVPGRLRAGGFTRISFGMQSARQHVLRRAGPHGTPRAGREAASRRRARPGSSTSNLDLIYGTPGETDDDWRASLDAAIGAGPGPRLRLRADRRGGHPAGPPDPPRRGADDRRRRPRRPLPDRRRGAGGGRLRLVRGVQLGARPRPAAAGTTSCTGAAPTGGASGPGAHSHVGGRALVERQAPGGLRRGAGRRAVTRRGPGGAAAGGPAGGADPAGAAASGGAAPVPAARARARRPPSVRCPRACWSRARTRRAARCSRCGAGCWRTRWSGTWWTEGSTPPRAGSVRQSARAFGEPGGVDDLGVGVEMEGSAARVRAAAAVCEVAGRAAAWIRELGCGPASGWHRRSARRPAVRPRRRLLQVAGRRTSTPRRG